jgi:photosystem II stability/assembly factor-like uncharacterized protein
VKLVLRGLLVVVAAAVAAQSRAAAPARPQFVTRPGSVIFWNARVGLLGVGYCVPKVVRCRGGAVERTIDGGRTYHVVLRTQGPVTALLMVGSRGAIATVSGGLARRTLDGGRTWREFLFKPFFWATPRIVLRFDAYYRGSMQLLALRLSHDGGRTFRRLTDPCNDAVTFNAYADLVTPKVWWILCVGRPAGGTADKAVFRTQDGGKTWQTGAANLGPPNVRVHGGIGLFGYPNGLAFARNGFGLVTESQGTLYVTRDGGLNFHAQRKVERPGVDYGAGAAAFSSGVGYVLLRAGFATRLVGTHDFSRTWRVVRRWSG